MISAAVIGAAATLLGNYMQSQAQERAMARQNAALRAEKAREDAWYTRRYYEDATQRADTSRALAKARETFMRANQAATGRAAVMGGTNAEAAAQKEANAQAYADAVSQVAAGAEDRKDKIDDAHQKAIAGLNTKKMELDAANDAANVASIGEMASQVGTIAGSAVATGGVNPADTGANTAGNAAGTRAAGTGTGQTSNSGKPYVGITEKVNNAYRDPMQNTSTVQRLNQIGEQLNPDKNRSKWGSLGLGF